jgi:integrase
MSAEIHDYEGALRRQRKIIKALKNGDLALSFLDHLAALGLSTARVAKYAICLPALLRVIDFGLREAKREDVERVVAWINRHPYKEWTKHDMKLLLRRLVQYAKYGRCDRDTPLPDEIRWISLRVRGKDLRVTPEKLLTPEDFEAIVKHTENSRDRALVHVLLEAALRPGELLKMNVGSVEFKEDHCLISVNGKTGIKRIPLVVSFKPLLEWLEGHPLRSDPNAPLWASLASNFKGSRLSYRHFRLIIKRLAKKAGLKKDVWPYLFRHSTLTALAKVFTEARLEQFAGWTYGSKMSRMYVHFSARDLEDAVLELHGLKKPETGEVVPKLVECPRCGNKSSPGNVRCSFCGLVMDRETALKIEEKEREEDGKIVERLEKLERMVSALLAKSQPDGGSS